jgi:maltose alpha-D-glucosyltransferase/alpha-amylase
MIIDFEGEPARPLNERRTKSLAMRDVAGMLRSFQYAAYSALFDRGSGAENLENWAGTWTERVSAAYLDGYLRAAKDNVFVPADPEERRIVLDAFVLHKALYEVAYEMNNRPDWVRIPLRGILSLIA